MNFQNLLENVDELKQFSGLVLSGDKKQISNVLVDFLHNKFKAIDSEIYFLNDKKIWKKSKSERILINEIGSLFSELYGNLSKNSIDAELMEKLKSIGLGSDHRLLFKLGTFTEEEKMLKQMTEPQKIKPLLDYIVPSLSPEDPEEFISNLNASPHELPLKNGKVLNLKYKVVRQRGNPADLLNKIDNDIKKFTPYKFDNDYFTFEIDAELTKDTKVADDFFKSLMCGNSIKTKYLQQILGSCLINGNPSQSFFIFTGEGSNGKSTLIKIMEYFLSKISSSIDPNLIIENSKNKFQSSSVANPHIVKLQNKRFIFLSETSKNDKLKEDFLKKMTGDDKITCRALYSNDTKDFSITATPILISNYKPTFDITKKAMLRRFKHIEFGASFVDKPSKSNEYKGNPNFWDDVFLPNKNAFFSWLVEGAFSFLNDNVKLNPPKEIQSDIESYLEEIDTIKQFISDRLIQTQNPQDRIPKKDMYDEFKLYCEDKGEPYRTKKDFYKAFEKIFKEVKSKGYWYYINLKLKDDDEEDEDGFINKQL